MLLCNNSEMNNENEEDLVAKMNNDNQVMLPVIDTSTRPSSSSAVNNQIYATNSVIEELQVRENLQNLMYITILKNVCTFVHQYQQLLTSIRGQ